MKKLALAIATCAAASSLSAITTLDENVPGISLYDAGPTYVISSDLVLGPDGYNSDTEYVLNGTTFVEAGSTLTIREGVTVYGQPRGSGLAPGTLVVSRGAAIDAVGTAGAPIIFTSAADASGNRTTAPYANIADSDPLNNPVDPSANLWGSLILLGYAPINTGTADTGLAGEATVEGLGSGYGELVTYGGNLPNDSSGSLSYVSIRNSGDTPLLDEELQGLTLGGVGAGTQVDHVEISGSGDDGIEIFGGTVNMSHILITFFDDDGLDVDQGWTGLAQFIFIIADGGAENMDGSDHLLELDGDDSGTDAGNNVNYLAVPVSHPTIYNLTAFGVVDGDGNDTTELDRVIYMRHGFGGQINNSVFYHAGTDSAPFTVENTYAGNTFNRLTNGFFSNLPYDQIDRGYLGLAGTTWYDIYTYNEGVPVPATTPEALTNSEETAAILANNTPSSSGNRPNTNPNFGIFDADGPLPYLQNVQKGINPVGTLNNPAGMVPVPSTFFQNVSYVGAFPSSPASVLWTTNWTSLNVRGILVDNGAGIDL